MNPLEEFGEAQRIAVAAAQDAGALLREWRQQEIVSHLKSDQSIVTEADLAAERLILQELRGAFPEDAVLSEEAGELPGNSGRRWIVDPLDGTSNFARGLPYFAVSIGLWEGDRPQLGVVYLPVLDELFVGVAGAGATLNGRAIQVSGTDRLTDAMINLYFDRHSRMEEGLDTLRRVALACEGRIKMLGSTASLLCYVASGRLDGYVKNVTRIWDYAAGVVVLAEAGGRLTDFEERPLTEDRRSLLASNGWLHPVLSETARGQR